MGRLLPSMYTICIHRAVTQRMGDRSPSDVSELTNNFVRGTFTLSAHIWLPRRQPRQDTLPNLCMALSTSPHRRPPILGTCPIMHHERDHSSRWMQRGNRPHHPCGFCASSAAENRLSSVQARLLETSILQSRIHTPAPPRNLNTLWLFSLMVVLCHASGSRLSTAR